MKKIKVRVPGTTANLGPGFDCLGMALTIYNTFTLKKISNGSLLILKKNMPMI